MRNGKKKVNQPNNGKYGLAQGREEGLRVCDDIEIELSDGDLHEEGVLEKA